MTDVAIFLESRDSLADGFGKKTSKQFFVGNLWGTGFTVRAQRILKREAQDSSIASAALK